MIDLKKMKQTAQHLLSGLCTGTDAEYDQNVIMMCDRIAELERQSVTKIMLDVVPGDGSGVEVYAKSVAEVEELLSDMGLRIEDQESEIGCLKRQLAERGEAVDLHDLFRLVLLEEFKNQPSYYNADQIDDAVCKAAGKYVSTAEKHGYSKLYTGPQIPEGYQEPESLDDYLARLEDGEPCYHKGCLSHVTHPCDGCGRIAGKSPQSEGVNHVADPS